MDTLGKRITFLLSKEGSNPNRLGKKLGIHPSTLKNYIDDKTTPHNLILDKISKYFNVSLDWLKTGEGDLSISDETLNVSEPTSPYGQFQGEIGVRLLNMLREYVPEDMTDILDKLDKEMIDLYEYREAYLKAKEMYRPK